MRCDNYNSTVPDDDANTCLEAMGPAGRRSKGRNNEQRTKSALDGLKGNVRGGVEALRLGSDAGARGVAEPLQPAEIPHRLDAQLGNRLLKDEGRGERERRGGRREREGEGHWAVRCRLGGA